MHLKNTDLDWSNNSSPQFINHTPPFFTHSPQIPMDPKSQKITKSLRDYIFRIKIHQRSQIKLPSKKWILAACKHPRTPSLDIDNMKNNNVKDDEAMLADIDRFLFENFKSLFLDDREEPDNNINRRAEMSPKLDPIRFDSSRRFFTDATTEEGSSSAMSESETAEESTVVPGNCVVVLANSGNPSEDFQRSMEGVVEARYAKN